MKRIQVLAVWSVIVLALSVGQTGCNPNTEQSANVSRSQTATTPTPSKVSAADAEKELTQIERDWAASIVKRDTSLSESHMADDVAMISPDGSTSTKSQFINEIKSGDLQLDSIDIRDIKVKVYGETAVATYRTTDKGKYKGQDISGDNRWIDVFVWRDGKWQVVAAQGTRVASPPTTSPSPSSPPATEKKG